jgi:hypothetical protein
MKRTLALSFAIALAICAVALAAATTATAHGCHVTCAWMWAGDGSGGGAWCGEEHNGDIYHRPAGGGYKCNWNNCCHPTAPLHDGYWVSGYGRVGLKPKPHAENVKHRTQHKAKRST